MKKALKEFFRDFADDNGCNFFIIYFLIVLISVGIDFGFGVVFGIFNMILIFISDLLKGKEKK